MALVKKYLPSEMVNAIQHNGMREELLERIKGDLSYMEKKYNFLESYNQGTPANFEFVKEEGAFIYIDIVQQTDYKISSLALSTKTIAVYIQHDQITNAVLYFVDEVRALLEMYTYDYIYGNHAFETSPDTLAENPLVFEAVTQN